MKKMKKIWSVMKRKIIMKVMYFNADLYMKLYTNYLRKEGMQIHGKPNYISNDVYFDGKDYSLITLSNNVTISREVMFLTHDYSMHTVSKDLSLKSEKKIEIQDKRNNLLILNEIRIGKNSFIGARTSLLPGTVIGENVLIGACSVVKGEIPNNSIVVGNPAKIVGNTTEWLERKIQEF